MIDVLILIEELILRGLSIAMTKRKASRGKMVQERISLEVGKIFFFVVLVKIFLGCRSHHHMSVEFWPEFIVSLVV